MLTARILAIWLDPTTPYDGPVDADLSDYDMRDLAAFWAEAQTETRATMRERWPEYRGKVPADLAAQIIDANETRRSQCS